eukprot:2840425-Alexandrium_andersonii.AAC.1
MARRISGASGSFHEPRLRTRVVWMGSKVAHRDHRGQREQRRGVRCSGPPGAKFESVVGPRSSSFDARPLYSARIVLQTDIWLLQ